MWVEFVVGSRPCSASIFLRVLRFSPISKTSINKFQFDLDYCQALHHEPLAREIAQVLLTLNLITVFIYLFITLSPRTHCVYAGMGQLIERFQRRRN